ncbi:hypothetical protein THAOC_10260 [Thalassiosira oceanica]|uniref:Uncharacterized protein n=1 Tax=Thalassiosira oceanica TaxID=159749 RepID=K0SQG4_THAOC|nr:hypothetical protein THAOC_10260 [Thalassiosira oceanica]|eukprot:EJK68548.1 hypothetical protein THAOC_10260 [Thalassiosira oceanica]
MNFVSSDPPQYDEIEARRESLQAKPSTNGQVGPFEEALGQFHTGNVFPIVVAGAFGEVNEDASKLVTNLARLTAKTDFGKSMSPLRGINYFEVNFVRFFWLAANNRSFESGQRRVSLLQYLSISDPEPYCDRALINASIIRRRRDENLSIHFKVIR